MAAMFHHQGPLQTFNRPDTSYCRAYRSAISAKRKSAVELLEETKCLYVKSETVLDSKQDLPLVKSPGAEGHQSPLAQDQPAHQQSASCSTKMAAVAQRRSNNSIGSSDQLQTKLRRLLNADSKENLADIETMDSSKKDSSSRDNSRSCHTCRSLPDLSASFGKEAYPVYTPSSSKEGSSSRHEEMSISISDETDSENSSDKSYGQPPSPAKSAVSFGGSASKAETRRTRTVEWEGVELGRLSRSKSEVGDCSRTTPAGLHHQSATPAGLHHQSATPRSDPNGRQQPPLPHHLDDFFQYLGLTSAQYSALTEDVSRCSSPVFFSSSSSVDSSAAVAAAAALRRHKRLQQADSASSAPTSSTPVDSCVPPAPSPLPSIVERNARVIKWLCHCTRTASANTA